MKLTETLSQEHRLIEQVLRCLHEMAARAESSGHLDVGPAESALRFLRTFAEGCHHKKEEEVLYPALACKDLGPEAESVDRLLELHALGRQHLAHLESEVGDARRRGKGAVEAFGAHVSAYSDLFRRQISNDDAVLFPLAEELIQGTERQRVAEGFRRTEDMLDHGDVHAAMLAVADNLGSRFGVALGASAEMTRSGD